MSIEYTIVVSGSTDSTHYVALEAVLLEVKKGSKPYEIEERFEQFDEVECKLFTELLDDHMDLFFCLTEVSATKESFKFGWEGYGYADDFLQRILQLLDVLGLKKLHGEAYGDEDVLRCHVTEQSIECEYESRV